MRGDRAGGEGDGAALHQAFPLTLADGATGGGRGADSLECGPAGPDLDGEVTTLTFDLEVTVLTATWSGDGWEADDIEGTSGPGRHPRTCPNLDLGFRFTATRDG